MPLFALTLDADMHGESKRIEFTAEDPCLAFHILERETAGREAVLWQGDRRLAMLQRTEAGVWRLAH